MLILKNLTIEFLGGSEKKVYYILEICSPYQDVLKTAKQNKIEINKQQEQQNDTRKKSLCIFKLLILE